AYLAPEVITLAETSPRADIYAIGIMGYEMLVGRLPYDGDTPLEIAAQHVNVAIPNVRTVVSWVPVELSDLLARFAARDPRARPRDGEMALTELKRVRRALESNSPELLARRATPPNDFEEPETGEIPVVAIEQVGRDSAQLDEIPTKAFTADPQNPPTPPEPSAEPELLRRGQRGWMIAAVLTGLLLVGGGVWWGLARSGAPAPGIPETLELPQRVVTVPLGLVGSPRAAGEAALREAGVRFGAIYYEYTDLAPAGEIIDISHLEGEAIPYDTVLVLTVSGGPSPVTIPQQIGREWSDAVSTLAALGLIVEFDPEQPSETMPRGLVLLQEPADGVVVRRGDVVTLTISAGQMIDDDDDGGGGEAD
ncbi:MAG: PASTA domain-containing protein, partial [Promicromonosporaceae bacterium]|nr:PASTA domain-containing protein [Promicromonosporaceae bacterium]